MRLLNSAAGLVDADIFLPFPKNSAISKFFREIGLADELEYGIRNTNKYLKAYSGGKPEFFEGDFLWAFSAYAFG